MTDYQSCRQTQNQNRQRACEPQLSGRTAKHGRHTERGAGRGDTGEGIQEQRLHHKPVPDGGQWRALHPGRSQCAHQGGDTSRQGTAGEVARADRQSRDASRQHSPNQEVGQGVFGGQWNGSAAVG